MSDIERDAVPDIRKPGFGEVHIPSPDSMPPQNEPVCELKHWTVERWHDHTGVEIDGNISGRHIRLVVHANGHDESVHFAHVIAHLMDIIGSGADVLKLGEKMMELFDTAGGATS